MAEETQISWAHATFNPWIGCSKVAPECAHCYAERDFDKRRHFAKWGDGGTRVLTSPANWRKPLQWNRKAAEAAKPARVFCASLADVFEDWKGPVVNNSGVNVSMDEVRQALWEVVAATGNLHWLMLTKRAENIPRFMPSFPTLWNNVWLGTSAGTQATAEAAIPALLQNRLRCRYAFVSVEPLLEPLDLRPWLRSIDWVIVGGESGPNARPMNAEWVRSLRDQCVEYSVPFFFKQWGGVRPGGDDVLDGVVHHAVPGGVNEGSCSDESEHEDDGGTGDSGRHAETADRQ